jgi:hypothetical protein
MPTVWKKEMHRMLVEQRVVYRTPTGRKGDHTRLGFKKLPRLVDKLKHGRDRYRWLTRSYQRLHEKYLAITKKRSSERLASSLLLK